jgi:outer membrane lipoprotein-sorting protein
MVIPPRRTDSTPTRQPAWALAALLLLAACPPPRLAERPYGAPSADELVAALHKRSSAIRSLRADTKVDHLGQGGERVKVTVQMLLARGGKLRMEAESPMGGALATLTSDGEKFALLDARANRFLEGPANACNVARLIRIALAPDDVVEVLTGGAPLEGQPAGVSWDPAGREVLELHTPDGGREIVKLDARNRVWDVLSAERTDAGGHVLWKLSHEKFSDRGGGIRLPERTDLTQPPTGSDARIRFREVEVNATPPDHIFELAPPQGVKVELAVCP